MGDGNKGGSALASPPAPKGSSGKVGSPSKPCPAASTANLEVTVTCTNDGQPVKGAKVKTSGAETREGTTDAKGRVLFRSVKVGKYTVTGSKSGYDTKSTKTTTSAGATAKASLSLKADVELGVTVTDKSTGSSIQKATVRISGPQTVEQQTDTSGTPGLARFLAIKTGDYQIRVTCRDYFPAEVKATVKAGPNKVAVKMQKVSIRIRAADGTSDPPTAVAVKSSVALKAAHPKEVTGTYQWKTGSKLIKLENATAQTVTVKAGKDPSAAPKAEEIELAFTPSGGGAKSTVKHKIGVASVVFSADASHSWGYDAYEKFSSQDKDNNTFDEQPSPAYDFVSIKKSGVGKVKVSVKGCEPKEIFFKSTKTGTCEPKAQNPTAASYTLEIQAKAKNKDDSAKIEARLGSLTGKLLGELGVVVLKEVTYKAEFFRVKDPASAQTNLKTNVTGADCQTGCNSYYKQGVAVSDITGGATDKSVAYDIVKNGKLDLEPGKQSDEQKKIMTACTSTRTRVIYVHDLRWAYYFAADAGVNDTKIKLKTYGATYLGYIGKKSYKIEDSKGNSTTVTVKQVNKTTGEVELTAKIGKAFKKADKTALIWPLGGLSGDPVLVSDVGSAAAVKNYVAHELGHQLCKFADVCEKDNVMYGGSTTGKNLRHRALKKYYKTAQTEKQWTRMSGR